MCTQIMFASPAPCACSDVLLPLLSLDDRTLYIATHVQTRFAPSERVLPSCVGCTFQRRTNSWSAAACACACSRNMHAPVPGACMCLFPEHAHAPVHDQQRACENTRGHGCEHVSTWGAGWRASAGAGIGKAPLLIGRTNVRQRRLPLTRWRRSASGRRRRGPG